MARVIKKHAKQIKRHESCVPFPTVPHSFVLSIFRQSPYSPYRVPPATRIQDTRSDIFSCFTGLTSVPSLQVFGSLEKIRNAHHGEQEESNVSRNRTEQNSNNPTKVENGLKAKLDSKTCFILTHAFKQSVRPSNPIQSCRRHKERVEV